MLIFASGKFGDLMWFCLFWWFWFGVACSLMFFNIYIYILAFWKSLERCSDSEVRAALGWDRKTDSGRLGSIFAAGAGRQISFPKLSMVNGEEWWTCKNTSPIFLGGAVNSGNCQEDLTNTMIDSVLQRWGNYFLTPQYRVCNWFDVILVLDMLKVFCMDITPLELITATIFIPFAYHWIIQVKFYSPYCNSPFPMIPSLMIPASYLSSHISWRRRVPVLLSLGSYVRSLKVSLMDVSISWTERCRGWRSWGVGDCRTVGIKEASHWHEAFVMKQNNCFVMVFQYLIMFC